MKKQTKLSIQWFYNLLERGECDIMDFKEQLEDKMSFGKSLKNFAPKYDETARDVVAFANHKGGFLFIGIVDDSKEINKDFVYQDSKVFELIHQVQDRTEPMITLIPHEINVEGKDLLVLELLKLAEKDRSKVSRLFAELVNEQEILKTEDGKPNGMIYRRISKT